MVDIHDEALAGGAAELGTTSTRDTVNTSPQYAGQFRERAAKVAAVTHLFGDPNGWDDPEVKHMLGEQRGRQSRR